jgi:signal transduction histidine kinase
MSLRVRLILLTVALVTVVVLILSGLYLNSLVDSLSATALDRAQLASQQVNAFINDRINRHALDQPAPADLEGTKTMWREIVANDPDVATMLFRTMALSAALLEINVGGQDGVILASSNPSRVGQELVRLDNFADWRGRSLYRRLVDLTVRKPDYQVVVPLGVGQQSIFTIQVVTSSVFLIDPVLPQVSTVAGVAAAALLLSLLLAGLATSRALRPLKRIEETIDRIAQGSFRGDEGLGSKDIENRPREFVALESKLNLLGQQYSGARLDNTNLKRSLDDKVASMASQFDVASRLAAISRISGGVAHEIKNPLNAIALRLDLLRAHAEIQDGQLIPEIDVLSKEVRRLDRVVKTFLDFSRPLEVRFAEVDLGALVGEVANLMTPQARVAGVEVHFQAPAETALMRGDADLLKQAVLNLVTNALEVMKQGGHLRLKVHRDQEHVVAEVSDDGPGIPLEVRNKVFQLYFTTKERGSGIGLAMTYRAVQLHNGTVDFTSEMGRGTTFRLQFPAVVHHV